ncbi:MAG: DUF262 domain-containing protein [Candidatus Izemoplasmatales bacterium]|nr:DUF262 domain-containing protein [Candidatus Izemoplasmatales bacterium]
MVDENKVVEGQVILDGVKGDNTKEEEQTDVMKELADAAEQSNDETEDNEDEVSSWSSERIAIKTILSRYADKKFQLPLCQRLYIWNEAQRKSLFDSVKHGLPCGTLIIAEVDGIQYLIDGLQRMVSLMMLTTDKTLSDEDHKTVRDYDVTLITVHDMSIERMKHYFNVLNSGIVLAAAVKERSKLSERLNNAILNVSGNQFFRDISKKANATFRKSHHHEIIAENILLANAGVKIGGNKAKDLCKRIETYEVDIMANENKATAVVNRLAEIFNPLDDEFIKRSMNANFVSVLVYIMHDYPEITNEQYVNLIKLVFASKRAVKDYTETTSKRSADEDKIKARYDLLLRYLNPTDSRDNQFDEVAYHEFCKTHNGKAINTRDNDHPVGFEDFTEDERKQLYVFCEVEKNMNKFEGVVIKVFNRVAKETEKESA